MSWHFKRFVLWILVIGSVGISIAWFTRQRRPVVETHSHGGEARRAVSAAPDAPLSVGAPSVHPVGAALPWLAVGGGGLPSASQVSIEQDLILAASVFGSGGWILFAGGAGSRTVQVTGLEAPADPLLQELADLFDPRPGRDAHYRRTELPAVGPASVGDVERALNSSLTHGDGPLLFYFAGHGDRGELPADNGIVLWGDVVWTAFDLAAQLDALPTRRQLRLVLTSCYSGGFADIVFAGADADVGIAAPNRCGLFAATAEEPSSGCDPDPDRRTHEGYGVLFLQALRGQDRLGNALPAGVIDLNGDGDVSLLEAHARARIASRSLDIPTSTSERWLRAAAANAGPTSAVELPEDEAVISALAMSTGLGRDRQRVEARLGELRQRLDEASQALERAQLDADDAYLVARAELLARWPVLDDPWHPAFAQTVEVERPALRKFLSESLAMTRFHAAVTAADAAAASADQLRVDKAPVERLARALETVRLAGRLAATGGPAWRTYLDLLACERSLPPAPP